jgi:hypothetical protein
MYIIKVVYKEGNGEYHFEAKSWEEVLEKFRDYADVVGAETPEELEEIEETYGSEFEIVFRSPQAPLGSLTLRD